MSVFVCKKHFSRFLIGIQLVVYTLVPSVAGDGGGNGGSGRSGYAVVRDRVKIYVKKEGAGILVGIIVSLTVACGDGNRHHLGNGNIVVYKGYGEINYKPEGYKHKHRKERPKAAVLFVHFILPLLGDLCAVKRIDDRGIIGRDGEYHVVSVHLTYFDK